MSNNLNYLFIKSLSKINGDLFHSFYIDKNQDLKKTTLLFSSTRSGSTWLSNIINYNNQYRLMFEPFHSDYVPEWSSFNYRQYLNPKANDSKAYNKVKKILNGSVRNKWVDYYNKKIFVEKRLIKDVRINLMSKWIYNKFPEISMIYLIRHPFSVALSRQKIGWPTHLECFLQQSNLYQKHLKPYTNLIKMCQDPLFKQIIQWCIENFLPIKWFNNNQIHIVYYENLCLNFNQEVKKIFHYLKCDYKQTRVSKFERKISQTSRKESAITQGRNLLNGWQFSMSPQKILQANKILKIFGLDELYDENSIPSINLI